MGGACSSSDLAGGADDIFPVSLALAWRGFLGGILTLRLHWQENKSSAVCPEYLQAVVTPHLRSRYVRMKRRTIAAGTSRHRIEHSSCKRRNLNLFETDTLRVV